MKNKMVVLLVVGLVLSACKHSGAPASPQAATQEFHASVKFDDNHVQMVVVPGLVLGPNDSVAAGSVDFGFTQEVASLGVCGTTNCWKVNPDGTVTLILLSVHSYSVTVFRR